MTDGIESEGIELDDEDLRKVYGESFGREPPSMTSPKRNVFLPWHHPVKQVVRDVQWAQLTKRLIEERRASRPELRYFTLPGTDLLDVRVLAETCASLGVRIDYFGFDSSQAGGLDSEAEGARVVAESSLRQADRITSRAVILPDRLEDIALAESQATAQLKLREPFDVVNIDACDNLSFRPAGRERSTFDAVKAILKHQIMCQTPWLLFVTTRVDPELLGAPGVEFQKAINDNIALAPEEFGSALARAIGAEAHLIGTALAQVWSAKDERFLRLYAIGLGKFLLQFFHNQPSLPARVELASAYAYRVHKAEPDMLALAFRVTPEGPRVFPAGTGGAVVVPQLEAKRAVYVAERAEKLYDIDLVLEKEPDVLEDAIENTITLLRAANYDIPAWGQWLAEHPQRPLKVDESCLGESD